LGVKKNHLRRFLALFKTSFAVIIVGYRGPTPSAKCCDCVVCRNNHELANHPDLLTEFAAGKITIFAGAGISTESRNVLKYTFYDDVAAELNLGSSPPPAFPDLMKQYCPKPNGRLKLFTKIRNRFKHINSFAELKKIASKLEMGSPIKGRPHLQTIHQSQY